MSEDKTISDAWAMVLPLAFADSLFSLRLLGKIEIALVGADLWLRGTDITSAITLSLTALPASHRFAWLEENRLRPMNSRFATSRFPEAKWQLLSKWIEVALPTAALPALAPAKVPLELVASIRAEEPSAMIARTDAWADWAANAPAARLKPLKFASSVEGRSLIMGAPLPSLAGERMIVIDKIIVPAGLTWKPTVSPKTVRDLFAVSGQNYLLLEKGGSQILPEEAFVSATRSAIQTTLAEAPDFFA